MIDLLTQVVPSIVTGAIAVYAIRDGRERAKEQLLTQGDQAKGQRRADVIKLGLDYALRRKFDLIGRVAEGTGRYEGILTRRLADGIRLHVVDEYETLFKADRAVRGRPLSLGELVEILDGTTPDDVVGFVEPYLEMNAAGLEDPDNLRDFIAVSSRFYPEPPAPEDMPTNGTIGRGEVTQLRSRGRPVHGHSSASFLCIDLVSTVVGRSFLRPRP